MANQKITVAESVANFLAQVGVKSILGVAGGASLHLIHAVESNPMIDFYALNHEQSVAMAAEAFSRTAGNIGVGIATSGPGATNLITGIAGAFYDSVPCMFITGQVSTFRSSKLLGTRQYGFQETPITEMVRPITKFVAGVEDPDDLEYLLNKAYEMATAGRPGPVLLDIPDDIQRMPVNPAQFIRPAPPQNESSLISQIRSIRAMILASKRPVLILGSGAKGISSRFLDDSLRKLQIPTVLTWGAKNLLPSNHPNLVGSFGTHGDRHANIVIESSDLILSLGSRLDTKATGSPPSTFAPRAKKIMVDIDEAEILKFRDLAMKIDVGVVCDSNTFLTDLMREEIEINRPIWSERCSRIIKECKEIDSLLRSGTGINPYSLMREVSKNLPQSANIFVDTGCALPYAMAGIDRPSGVNVFHDFNNTAMGWSIPASIGGHLAQPDRPTLTIIGDGSIMMGMHDLPTLAKVNSRAKVLLLDNFGYSMIRQTQDQWLGSEYCASSVEGGLCFIAWDSLAIGSGFDFLEAKSPKQVANAISDLWQAERPTFLRVAVHPEWRVIPQVKFGNPNYMMEPELSLEALKRLLS